MRDINLDAPLSERITCLVYGPSGNGKTEFAATWPRPLMFCQSIEDGYETIINMDRAKWYEPNVKPIVKVAEDFGDMHKFLLLAEEMIKTKGVKTIVFDQVTAWMDFINQFFLDSTPKEEQAKNKYVIPQKMFKHAQAMAIGVHKLNVHVVWTALSTFDEETKIGGPLLAGQTAKKLPSWCKAVMYAHVDTSGDSPVYQMRTRPFNRFIARTRYGLKVPNPLPPDPINPAWGPTYRSLEKCLKEAADARAAELKTAAAQKK